MSFFYSFKRFTPVVMICAEMSCAGLSCAELGCAELSCAESRYNQHFAPFVLVVYIVLLQ